MGWCRGAWLSEGARGRVRTEEVSFYSEGDRIAATLNWPDALPDGRIPAIVQGPGWMGLRTAKLYDRYHRALTGAGYVVLAIDYRGFGESGGQKGLLLPQRQLEDLRNAVTYLQTRSEIHPDRIGAFGSGGTGGGNAVYLAGVDPRVKVAVCQVGVADGEDWLRRMRREYEWVEFKQRLEQDRRQRVLTGESTMVSPRDEIMIQTPERRETAVKKDVDSKLPDLVPLACAEAIMQYKPIDVVDRIAPRAVLFIAVELDAVTPEDHSYRMYERARPPKRLIVQRGTSHYKAYDQYGDIITPQIVEWYDRHLGWGPIVTREERLTDEAVLYLHPCGRVEQLARVS